MEVESSPWGCVELSSVFCEFFLWSGVANGPEMGTAFAHRRKCIKKPLEVATKEPQYAAMIAVRMVQCGGYVGEEVSEK